MGSLEEQFNLAQEHFKGIVDSASNRQKLRMYGLWNQVTHGDNTKKAPSKMSVVYVPYANHLKCVCIHIHESVISYLTLTFDAITPLATNARGALQVNSIVILILILHVS